MPQFVLMLAATVLGASPATQPVSLPTSLDLTTIRTIPLQHDGRWLPLDTVARDMASSVTGTIYFDDHDPVLVLLAWTFAPKHWMHQPLINVDEGLRRNLELPQDQETFSYLELIGHDPLRKLLTKVARAKRGTKLSSLETKVRDLDETLFKLQQALEGHVIKPIPDPKEMLAPWQPIRPAKDGKPDAVQSAWAALGKAFLADDGPAFQTESDKLAAALAALPAKHRPDPKLLAKEVYFNRLHPFRVAWIIMVVGTVLAALAMAVRKPWFDVLAVLALLAGFGVLTYGLLLRWQIAGRIPAANMFESLLFLSWGMGAFAVIAMLVQRQRIVPLTTSAMGALSLFLAEYPMWLDPFIRPIQPVLLDTIWMSIHVPIIMVSYSVLALAVLIAHVQLVGMAVAPRHKPFIKTIDTLHYWYVHIGAFLLLVGIITGSMWAASSWGRYWGWDPKEVWSLVAFLGYLAILHVRLDRTKIPGWAYAVAAILAFATLIIISRELGPLTTTAKLALAGAVVAMIIFVTARGAFATALKSILVFWLIIMTYLGVNYVLGTGLHSYGFGGGTVFGKMLLVATIDLAFIALCTIVYLIHSRASSNLSPQTA